MENIPAEDPERKSGKLPQRHRPNHITEKTSSDPYGK
jgi:hypothetical protein